MPRLAFQGAGGPPYGAGRSIRQGAGTGSHGPQKAGEKWHHDGAPHQTALGHTEVLGARPHTTFQFVKHDELQLKIRQKEQSSYGITKSHKDKQIKAVHSTLMAHQLDPDLLEVIPDTLMVPEGTHVPHLGHDQLRHGAMGITISTVPDLLPHLRAGKILSQKPLAVLTVGEVPADETGTLEITNLRYPVFHVEAKEAILVNGSLVQLGNPSILRKEASKDAQAHISTQVLKVVVCKDQWLSEWATFVTAPVKITIEAAPTFMLCRTPLCGTSCGFFHAPCDEEDIETVVMDVWTLAIAGSRFLQLPHASTTASHTLQCLSGQRGIYVEPRDSTGRTTDAKYGVIWMPGHSLKETSCKLAATPKVIALVRKQDRYGLRFTNDHMEAAHKELKPNAPFEYLAYDRLFHISPLPHGMQRPALQQLLKAWTWAAKPLQPKYAGPHGITWEVGSASSPPSTVLQHSGGDVVITEVTKEAPHRPFSSMLQRKAGVRFRRLPPRALLPPYPKVATLGNMDKIPGPPGSSDPRFSQSGIVHFESCCRPSSAS